MVFQQKKNILHCCNQCKLFISITTVNSLKKLEKKYTSIRALLENIKTEHIKNQIHKIFFI